MLSTVATAGLDDFHDEADPFVTFIWSVSPIFNVCVFVGDIAKVSVVIVPWSGFAGSSGFVPLPESPGVSPLEAWTTVTVTDVDFPLPFVAVILVSPTPLAVTVPSLLTDATELFPDDQLTPWLADKNTLFPTSNLIFPGGVISGAACSFLLTVTETVAVLPPSLAVAVIVAVPE